VCEQFPSGIFFVKFIQFPVIREMPKVLHRNNFYGYFSSDALLKRFSIYCAPSMLFDNNETYFS